MLWLVSNLRATFINIHIQAYMTVSSIREHTTDVKRKIIKNVEKKVAGYNKDDKVVYVKKADPP